MRTLRSGTRHRRSPGRRGQTVTALTEEITTLDRQPYQQRRAYATCRNLWPEVDVVCASHPLSLDDYMTSIGDADKVIHMLVGDTQRIDKYAELGFAIPQEVPAEVRLAYARLVDAGYTSRLV